MISKISVVVTTYNRPDLLKKSLISVFQQSKKPFEIILINNFPKPIEIADKKNLVKVYNLPRNLGISNARNIGATLAKGDYIAFLDDDDLWPKSYIKKSENYIINHSPKILLSKIYVKNGSGLKLFKNPNKKINLKNILLMNPGITGSNIIINRKIFFKLNGYDSNLIPSEDKSICIDALINNIKIHIQNNYIIYRIIGADHISKNNKVLYCGFMNFYKKYKPLMNLKIRIFFLYKLYVKKIRSGRYHAILNVLILKMIILTINFFKFNYTRKLS